MAAIFRTWRGPGRVMRDLARRGLSEPGLLTVLLGAMLLSFVAQWPVHARAARLDPSVPLDARLAGALVATMFLMPLVAYFIAWAAGVIMRIPGRMSRLALFWALLAVSPAMLLCGLLAGMIGSGPAVMAVQGATGLAFAAFWCLGLRALKGTVHEAA